MLKKVMAIVVLTSGLVLSTACNTVRGAGEDVQSVANAVDDVDD